MASPKIEVVLEACCPSLGEGPHWDDASQTLLYVDIRTGGVHRYDPQTKQESKVPLGMLTKSLEPLLLTKDGMRGEVDPVQ